MFAGSVARWADRRSFDCVRTLRVLTSLRMTISFGGIEKLRADWREAE
jgi:hypothetical protein